MTRSARCVRLLWRVNAVVVLVAGLLVSAAAAIVIVAMARAGCGRRRRANYKGLLQNVERVLGVEFLSDTVVDVAFSAVADYIAEVDLSRREVRRRALLRYHQRH